MTLEVNLYGPPGSGKTRQLIRLYIAACQRVGPERVAAVTYTRAAADELRLRAAPALGIAGNIATLRRHLPWVGTIHALKYRLLGLRSAQVTTAEEFLKGDAKGGFDPDYTYPADGEWDNTDPDEQAMWMYGVARHRMMSFDDLLDKGLAPDSRLRGINRERARHLIREYQAWKDDKKKIDFEDMLERDSGVRLPVSVMICDEVQDNSPLLWSVLDKWGRTVRLRIHAGDPYQAIYSFAGADPQLFLVRKPYGHWIPIGNSHRFDDTAATYAKAVITAAHGDDPILRTWHGVGQPDRDRDGSELHLARTHSLLAAHRADLLDAGTPFREYARKAPLQGLSGQAYRILYRVRQGEGITGGELADVLRAARRLPKVVRDRRDTLDGDRMFSPADVERILGRPAKYVADGLQYADYFKALLVRGGNRALFLTPKLVISTIHGAKGREADSVTLIRSWGYYPAAAVHTGQGARDEACVAYVAVSRHRHSLQFVDSPDGIPYPFPSPRAVAQAAAPTSVPVSR